jgi:hypothetical protein
MEWQMSLNFRKNWKAVFVRKKNGQIAVLYVRLSGQMAVLYVDWGGQMAVLYVKAAYKNFFGTCV